MNKVVIQVLREKFNSLQYEMIKVSKEIDDLECDLRHRKEILELYIKQSCAIQEALRNE